jgi:hypothetical protein
MPAGSSRVQRLDPFSLPARFAATDAAADERVWHMELYRKRVVVRRSLDGMRMALNMPVSAFAGVALRVLAGEDEAEVTASVTLEHKDPSREPFARMGGVRVNAVRPRRRRRSSALKRRRPSMPLRRQAGKLTEATPVHRGEREIIARNWSNDCHRPRRRAIQ